MPGPFDKDISYSLARARLVAIIVNLISSYFVFRVQCSLFPKFCVFLLAMATLYMVFLEELNENPQMKSRSEVKTEHREDGANKQTSLLSLLFVLLPIFSTQTTDNLQDINYELVFYLSVALISVIFVYLYWFAGEEKWENKLGVN